MKKQEVVRLYRFSDGNLVAKGLEKIAFMRRDESQFSNYGVTSTEFTALENSINFFSDKFTDTEKLGDQINSTTLKEAKAETLREAIKGVMSRVALRFGTNSTDYRKFGTDTLSRQPDSDLYVTAKRVVRAGTLLLPELTASGLTAAQLDNITTIADAFSDLMVSQKMEIGNRDIEQEDRVEAGNEIYITLVKYTNLGQSIWESNDVAKYNDYVMYNTVSGAPEVAPPPVV